MILAVLFVASNMENLSQWFTINKSKWRARITLWEKVLNKPPSQDSPIIVNV